MTDQDSQLSLNFNSTEAIVANEVVDKQYHLDTIEALERGFRSNLEQQKMDMMKDFVMQVIDYPHGCSSGKEDFLRDLGLDHLVPQSKTVYLKVALSVTPFYEGDDIADEVYDIIYRHLISANSEYSAEYSVEHVDQFGDPIFKY